MDEGIKAHEWMRKCTNQSHAASCCVAYGCIPVIHLGVAYAYNMGMPFHDDPHLSSCAVAAKRHGTDHHLSHCLYPPNLSSACALVRACKADNKVNLSASHNPRLYLSLCAVAAESHATDCISFLFLTLPLPTYLVLTCTVHHSSYSLCLYPPILSSPEPVCCCACV